MVSRNTQGEKPTWKQLEEEMLKGQKLQGVRTAEEVYDVLCSKGWQHRFPLFTAIHRIATDQVPVERILEYRAVAEETDADGHCTDDPYGIAATIESRPPPN
jgi:glycerol-3-phosphate dehydrogenase